MKANALLETTAWDRRIGHHHITNLQLALCRFGGQFVSVIVTGSRDCLAARMAL
jgi:hypothetical protein